MVVNNKILISSILFLQEPKKNEEKKEKVWNLVSWKMKLTLKHPKILGFLMTT